MTRSVKSLVVLLVVASIALAVVFAGSPAVNGDDAKKKEKKDRSWGILSHSGVYSAILLYSFCCLYCLRNGARILLSKLLFSVIISAVPGMFCWKSSSSL